MEPIRLLLADDNADFRAIVLAFLRSRAGARGDRPGERFPHRARPGPHASPGRRPPRRRNARPQRPRGRAAHGPRHARVRVIMLLPMVSEEYADAALSFGAVGSVSKDRLDVDLSPPSPPLPATRPEGRSTRRREAAARARTPWYTQCPGDAFVLSGSPGGQVGRIGAHVSARVDWLGPSTRRSSIGAECLQVFVGAPQNWALAPTPTTKSAPFEQRSPPRHLRPLFVHAPYLINLASLRPRSAARPAGRSSSSSAGPTGIGALGVVVHVGSGGDDAMERRRRASARCSPGTPARPG